jgi:hypothetical protein
MNTTVFTLGIGVLLRGLTWPGVVNAWFLGTVRLLRTIPSARSLELARRGASSVADG